MITSLQKQEQAVRKKRTQAIKALLSVLVLLTFIKSSGIGDRFYQLSASKSTGEILQRIEHRFQDKVHP